MTAVHVNTCVGSVGAYGANQIDWNNINVYQKLDRCEIIIYYYGKSDVFLTAVQSSVFLSADGFCHLVVLLLQDH